MRYPADVAFQISDTFVWGLMGTFTLGGAALGGTYILLRILLWEFLS